MCDCSSVVSCGRLPPPRNGKKYGTRYLEGNTLSFSCNEGFHSVQIHTAHLSGGWNLDRRAALLCERLVLITVVCVEWYKRACEEKERCILNTCDAVYYKYSGNQCHQLILWHQSCELAAEMCCIHELVSQKSIPEGKTSMLHTWVLLKKACVIFQISPFWQRH